MRLSNLLIDYLVICLAFTVYTLARWCRDLQKQIIFLEKKLNEKNTYRYF